MTQLNLNSIYFKVKQVKVFIFTKMLDKYIEIMVSRATWEGGVRRVILINCVFTKETSLPLNIAHYPPLLSPLKIRSATTVPNTSAFKKNVMRYPRKSQEKKVS